MNRLFVILALAMLSLGTASAQFVYTRPADDLEQLCKAQRWMEKGCWRQGFQKASPHRTVNALDFYEQYKKNPQQWKAMFRWLSQTDVTALPKGKTPIPGTSLVASVEDSSNGPLETRQSESHYKHIDFQWAVKGKERFGIIEHTTSKPNCAYRPDVIHYDYDLEKARFFDSNPAEFFIFFPNDWHIAKVNNDTNDQVIRVIVIKVDYIE